MNKGIWVGLGSIIVGLTAIVVLRFIFSIHLSFPIITSIIGGVVIFTALQAYQLGKKDGLAQKIEQDRTTEGEED